MPYVILGLLVRGPLSMYDLHKWFSAAVSLFYSASFGGIQRALRQLVSDGAATVADDAGSARGRRLYSITPSGLAQWREWMLSPVAGTDAETTVLSRVFLAGRLQPDDRAVMLTQVRTFVSGALAELRALDADLSTTAVPADAEEAAAFQRATLDYGIRSHELMLTWIEELRTGDAAR